MSNSRITPFVKRERVQGGTIFVFSSATEDIGLNINERNNIVKFSNFALLNIPSINIPSTPQHNTFNVYAIDGAFRYFNTGDIKDGRVIVAESFQNYALNLEANLLNQTTYNPALTATISERVFWKWLKETGAIRWEKDASNASYFIEELDTDSSVGYNSIVKYIGEISAGSLRQDTFGTYNETYILIPTSHGQTKVYFKQEYDDNYFPDIEIGPGLENILGRETYTKPHPDGLSLQSYYDVIDSSTVVNPSFTMSYFDKDNIEHNGWWYTAQGKEVASSTQNYYLTDSSIFIQDASYYNTTLKYSGTPDITFKRSNIDGLTIEYDLDNLKTIYVDSTLTYDKIAIDYSTDSNFNFNAVLIYYSVYNQTLDKILTTNLLGILFLDAAYGNTSSFPSITSEIVIPGLTKLQSDITGFGNSFSFRINIKSDNMLDDTQALLVDESTSAQADLENWADVFSELEKSIRILNIHTDTINYITLQYNNISNSQTDILNRVIDIQNTIQDVSSSNISGTPGVISMFDSGSNPLVDSSIYMKSGFVGIKTNDPKYPFEVDGSTKVKTLYIENSIRDTSNNILISYGSPLQLGSTTIFREMKMYTGNVNPAIAIDISNFVTFDKKLNLYLIESSLGNSFYWNAGKLDVSAGSGFYTLPIASGVTLGGIKVGTNLTIDNSTGVLSVTTGTFATKTYIDGSLNARDVSIAYLNSKIIKHESSIGNLTNKINVIDASLITKADISYVDASLNVKTSFTYVDGSLAKRDACIDFLFNNIGSGFATINYVDASIGARDVSIAWLLANKPSFNYVDGSLAARDTSIDWLNTNKANYTYVDYKADISYVDASLLKRDASIDWLYQNVGTGFVTFSYADGSLAARDTSIDWLNTNKTSFTYVDGSLNVKTNKTYVDSSLNARDVSIAWLNANKASITYVNTYAATKIYVDASLLARDTSIAWLNTNKADASSLTLYLKEASLGTDFYFDASGFVDISTGGIFGKYNTSLDPSLAMPSTVGGIAAGTTVNNLKGRTFISLFDDLLFPTVNPTLNAPSHTFVLSPYTLQEVGTVMDISANTVFSRGSIMIGATFQDYRSGLPNNYNLDGSGLIDASSASLTNAQNISGYTVIQGNQPNWSCIVSYDIGPQPYDNKGNPYSTPLAAGDTTIINRTFEGVYPLFATTVNITTLTKQTLLSMSTTPAPSSGMTLVAETGGNKQKFEIPDAWTAIHPLTNVQTYNTISLAWENTGLATWDTSTSLETIQSIPINYTKYIYNGDDRGSVQIRLVF